MVPLLRWLLCGCAAAFADCWHRYVDQTDSFVGSTYGKQVDNGGPPFVVSAASGVKGVLSLKKATLIAPHERTGPLYGK